MRVCILYSLRFTRIPFKGLWITQVGTYARYYRGSRLTLSRRRHTPFDMPDLRTDNGKRKLTNERRYSAP